MAPVPSEDLGSPVWRLQTWGAGSYPLKAIDSWLASVFCSQSGQHPEVHTPISVPQLMRREEPR